MLREHIRSHHSAPDAVHGTTLTPYYCSLCGDLFAVSLELIHHLIEHSDQSTAAKRVQPTGPRKYKRRRKLNGDSDNSDFVTMETNFQRQQKAIKQEPNEADVKKKNIFSSAFPVPDDVSEFKLPDEIFQAAGKRVPVKSEKAKASTSGARPKMIYTQKTRIAVSDGKRKTKTMIQKRVLHSKVKPTRVVRQQQPQQPFFEHDESSGTWSNDDPNEDVLDTLMKRERKLSEKFTSDLVNDLQDILRSPLKTNDEINDHADTSTRRSSRQVMSRYGTSPVKKAMAGKSRKGKEATPELSEDDDDEDGMEQIFIKEEILEEGHLCGICGDAFATRTLLLSHVPVHI